mgnify:CR=1 FL=1
MKNYLFLICSCILIYGLSTVFRKLSLERVNVIQFQLVASICYAATIPIWVYVLNSGEQSIRDITNESITFAVICTALQMSGALIFGSMLKSTKDIGVVTAMVSLSPIVTLAVSIMIFGEKLTVGKIIAFLFAILSVVFLNF